MTQVLIVDDENIVVEDLLTTFDWKKLGITKVFTAFSMKQAKEVFRNNTVDIMLCDIEMPQGSGLDLLAWVKENHPKVESIFITCHMDFGYAKEAIRLGSLGYILKPISFEELEASINKAIEKIKNDSKLAEQSNYSKFWFKYQPLVTERFWLDILNSTIYPSQDSIKKAAEARNIPYDEEMKFLPVLIGIRRWHTEWSLHDKKTMEYAVKNIAGETIIKEDTNGQLIDLGGGKFVVILSRWEGMEDDLRGLKNNCRICIDACNKYLNCDISCYIGVDSFAFELPEILEKLHGLERSNISYESNVFLLEENGQKDSSMDLPDINMWSVLLTEGSFDTLISDIMSYFKKLTENSKVDGNKLKQIHHDFMQMVYTYLSENNIHAHELLEDDESQKLYEKALLSVVDLMEWIKHVIGKVSANKCETHDIQPVVIRAQKYIKKNIGQKITRKDVADHVYLCPDYLDRLFKKEIGLSVTKYIVKERISNAQELLSKTQMPISEIAASNGFMNFSHFSKALKRYTNMKPRDYRKSSVKNDE